MSPGFVRFGVKDITLDDVLSTDYDLAIFASGYEQRCTQCISLVDPARFRDSIVLGFKTPVISELRTRSDLTFNARLNREPLVETDNLPQLLSQRLTAAISNAAQQGRSPRILVDYSSMRREWYGFILAFMTHAAHPTSNSAIDFLYSFGDYPPGYQESIECSVLESIAPLVGMEGLSASRSSSIAIFGLGFSPIAGLGALERLQPDQVFCFLADPEGADEYIEIAKKCNESLIRRASGQVIELPLGSLSSAYRGIAELSWPFIDRYHINILPMGPKPHILASMLTAQTYRAVSCLYGKVRNSHGIDIPGNGKFSIGRVSFLSQ